MIKLAAIKHNKYGLFVGLRHNDIVHNFYKAFNINLLTENNISGFLTDTHIFLTRSEAAKYAFQNNQITDEIDVLYSENLW
jgi:hypothetical protein